MLLLLSEELISEKKRNPALATCKLGEVVTKWRGTEAGPNRITHRQRAQWGLMTPDAQLHA